jgi:methanogenic corrinoid protein MtbC1
MKTIEQQIADTIYASANQISNEIVAIQQPKWADISPKYGMTQTKHSDYVRHDLFQLAEALMANNPPQYARYTVWLRAMFKSYQVPDFVVDLNLGTEQAALARVLPPECQPTVLRFMQTARDALKEDDKINLSFSKDTEANTTLAKQYLEVLLAGERGKASELIAGAIDSGISIRDIYLRVLKPCLYEVGRMWQTGRITVAHEHFFSAATQLIMSELYPRIHKQVHPNGKVAIAACVEGELHEIGLRMISDLLELEGWRTFYLGANTPALSVVEITREKKAHLLALSICLPSSGPALRELISIARERLGEKVKIVIGGYTILADPVYAASFGADGLAADAEEATTMIDRLVNGGKAIAW